MKRFEKIEKNKAGIVHSRTVQEKAPRSFNIFYFLLIIMLLAGAGYLIFFSGLLAVKKYQVSGYSHPETIEELAREESEKNIFGNNILFYQTKKIKDIIGGDPYVETVSISKKLPNTIVISIVETKPSIIWVTAGDKYLISDRGAVMGKVNEEKLPEVYDAANIKVNPGERVASPTFINFILVISEKFAGATGTGIARINIFDILSDVHVVSSAGWTVYFNSSKDPAAQLSNLVRVLEETKRAGTKRLEYIDMRIDTKIYYK